MLIFIKRSAVDGPKDFFSLLFFITVHLTQFSGTWWEYLSLKVNWFRLHSSMIPIISKTSQLDRSYTRSFKLIQLILLLIMILLLNLLTQSGLLLLLLLYLSGWQGMEVRLGLQVCRCTLFGIIDVNVFNMFFVLALCSLRDKIGGNRFNLDNFLYLEKLVLLVVRFNYLYIFFLTLGCFNVFEVFILLLLDTKMAFTVYLLQILPQHCLVVLLA